MFHWLKHTWSKWTAPEQFNGNVWYQSRTCAKCGRVQKRSC